MPGLPLVRLTVVTLFLLLVQPAWSATDLAARQEITPAKLAAVDSMARALLDEGVTVGLGLSILHRGEIVHSAGYGLADLEHRVAATDSTVFRIGSITKQMTAAAILRLREEGRLSLDDPVERHLPDFPPQGHRVTIHHLLTHTSGIRSYTGLGPRWAELQPLELSHDELVDLFRDEPFDFAPGEEYRYNNSAYYLLGMIVEELTGMGYDEYLAETFFGPLGLRETRYCWVQPVIPNRARGYVRQGEEGELRNAPHLGMSQPGAAGAICSSARDLVRWDEALRNGRVVSPESYALMTTPAELNGGDPTGYGYGLALGRIGDFSTVAHGGGINGFNAQLTHIPEAGLTVAAVVNLNGPGAGRAVRDALRILLEVEDEGG